VPQGGDEGHGLPVAVGRMGDQPFRINARLVADPLFAPAPELWPQLLGGQNRFF
jgi:hypothetical protein